MPTLEDETAASASAGQSDRKSANFHSRNHNYFHSLTSSPVGTDNSQRFHNANDCSNNGQSAMGTTMTVLSTSLASFNGNSIIDNDGHPYPTSSNNSITCHRDHNSSFNTITNNSGRVCHSYTNEMNSSTKVAVPSPKMTSGAEHLTGGSTSTKTTSIFDSIDDNIVGMVPTSAFVKPQELEQPSIEVEKLLQQVEDTMEGEEEVTETQVRDSPEEEEEVSEVQAGDRIEDEEEVTDLIDMENVIGNSSNSKQSTTLDAQMNGSFSRDRSNVINGLDEAVPESCIGIMLFFYEEGT
uniref:Uncharacterized protein n=1 Tax=Glossina pallidipes TaxID=7398 RepID=A0A1B0AEZ6_GLOPL